MVAGLWAVKHYAATIDGYLDSNGAPHDLAVFLRAASDVIHGSSPYSFQADQTYAYPPLLAFLAAPLHPLGLGAATLVWTLLSLTAVGLALWLLGLRDWRCYALTAVFPFTRSAIDLGTIAPLLLLALAAAWRWRDRIAVGAAATGLAIALKLFLWPLAVWLALMHRLRAAAAALGFALVLVIVPWAAIGFAGIGGYPGLLHRLSSDEATSSYSVVALAVRAHLPEAVGVALSIVLAVALIAAAVWTARNKGRSRRERDVAVLALVLAAGLAASPIVWVHYFLLLLVPLALTRPRLSPLWFLPFVYHPLGESAWPAGDARKLGLALVVTLILLSAAVFPEARLRVPRGRRAAKGSLELSG
jgi:alpha-1,2-mannosyltransferase